MRRESVTLNRQDEKRLRVMKRLQAGIMTNTEPAAHLEVSAHRVIRIKKKYTEGGARGLIHGNKGWSTWHAPEENRKAAIAGIFKDNYSICSFTHFRDLLEENVGINVSCSNAERILRAEGISSKK